ncbi:hypothetical protein TNCV_264901 [Trichonephila clavipes]|nr:hypothetical protein TNCV_264901 [Trichonephila clavipes]
MHSGTSGLLVIGIVFYEKSNGSMFGNRSFCQFHNLFTIQLSLGRIFSQGSDVAFSPCLWCIVAPFGREMGIPAPPSISHTYPTQFNVP